jgi:hypothetical protein
VKYTVEIERSEETRLGCLGAQVQSTVDPWYPQVHAFKETTVEEKPHMVRYIALDA